MARVTTNFKATLRQSVLASLLALTVATVPALAQDPAAPQPPPAQADPDVRVDPLQPDFTLVALPVTLRMPVHKFAFRVTHRFTTAVNSGDFGDLLARFFGFDSGAQIGLELRFGLFKGNQIGVHRTSDRTIQIFDQHSIWQERDGHPLGLDAIVTIEGTNNMQDEISSAIGLLASRKVGGIVALYAEPIYIFNTRPELLTNSSPDNDTFMLGLGARVRVRPMLYLVGEITPRLWGFQPGEAQTSFGIEVRPGGHLFQINVGNGFGTTLGQLAHNGGFNFDNWFLGFNISRKFF
jgi:hypothetical protein